MFGVLRNGVRMKKATLIYTVLLGAFITAFSYAQVYQQSNGRNSPNVSGVQGSVTITNGRKMGPKDDSPACKCDPEALDYAVIERLREADVDPWGLGSDATEQDYLALKKRIERTQIYAAKLKDRCLREKYNKWLEWSEDSANNAIKQSKEMAGKKGDYYREQAKTKAALAEAERCKRSGIVPALPR